MTQVSFYQLTLSTIEQALPKVLEKVVDAGLRTQILTPSEERTEVLNKSLWTYHPHSFLPHGSALDGPGENQPIWLSHLPKNENNATVIALVDHVFHNVTEYDKCLYFFNKEYLPGNDLARKHWSVFQEQGHSCHMWLQNPAGGWEKSTQFIE